MSRFEALDIRAGSDLTQSLWGSFDLNFMVPRESNDVGGPLNAARLFNKMNGQYL